MPARWHNIANAAPDTKQGRKQPTTDVKPHGDVKEQKPAAKARHKPDRKPGLDPAVRPGSVPQSANAQGTAAKPAGASTAQQRPKK